MDRLRVSAARVQGWLVAQTCDPLAMLRRMKFKSVGYHPIEGHALNLVEQINQTWTFAVAVAATRQLLQLHPDAGGFQLAPGAHAALELDIMSEVEGLVGAETFATVHPRNNRKLEADLAKLASRPELHRYVFFLSPNSLATNGAHNLSAMEFRYGRNRRLVCSRRRLDRPRQSLAPNCSSSAASHPTQEHINHNQHSNQFQISPKSHPLSHQPNYQFLLVNTSLLFLLHWDPFSKIFLISSYKMRKISHPDKGHAIR